MIEIDIPGTISLGLWEIPLPMCRKGVVSRANV